MKVIEKYFPQLSEQQKQQFEILAGACRDWNEKINVISRKDTDNIEINHILHSLAIGKYISFTPGSMIIDLGTGGGFPGIPLAILFPDVNFHLVDRIGKKILVAKSIAEQCGLTNVTFQQGDFKECKTKADFVVSRAVMPQDELVKLTRKNIRKEQNNAIPNGLITLKGGNIDGELKGLTDRTDILPVSNYFDEPFFETKKIVYTTI